MIDPRVENPFPYIELDLLGTFRFIPTSNEPSSIEYLRAKYTIEVLRLNTRPYLVRARRIAYGNYKAKLEKYIRQRNNDISREILQDTIADILDDNHPTVWFEMKRSREDILELNKLFTEAPEALTW